jgi:protein ImuB
MTRRILSVWLPHWPITRLSRNTPASQDRPLVTIETIRGVRHLVAMGEAGEAHGLFHGQTLTAARAVCPALVPVDADPAADEAALGRLAAWCERYTPMVAPEPPDGLWLDITGCTAEFSSEGKLVRDLRRRLERNRVSCRIAVAATPGAAWALARAPSSWPGLTRPSAMDRSSVPLESDGRLKAGHDGKRDGGHDEGEGDEKGALADLPITCLRLEAGVVVGLRRLGLRTVKDLLRIPRAQMTARFGAMPLLRLDQALGEVDEAIDWPRPPLEWHERLAFPDPIGTAEDLARALARLSERLCSRLGEQGKGGQRFGARFFRVDDIAPGIAVSTALPVRDPTYLTKLLCEKLDTVDPGFGIEVIALEAESVLPMGVTQTQLMAAPDTSDELAGVVDMLSNRLGADRVLRVVPYASHVPECSVRRAPPLPMKQPSWVSDPASPRPIRLLHRPEEIDVIAPVPDDPPIRFSWRGVAHRVRAAAGPERIAAEWWRGKRSGGRPETDLIRDYYRVEDSDGARFWIFRAGLHGEERTPQWYLHGLFG